MGRTIKGRLPTKVTSIEIVTYQILPVREILSMRFPDLLALFTGLGCLFFSTWGVSGLPTYMVTPLEGVTWTFVAIALVMICWRRLPSLLSHLKPGKS
jgi:membrane protein implicated in regulation of membrane protease activity